MKLVNFNYASYLIRLSVKNELTLKKDKFLQFENKMVPGLCLQELKFGDSCLFIRFETIG